MVSVTYIRDVDTPLDRCGSVGDIRDLEDSVAALLAAEGYVTINEPVLELPDATDDQG